MPDADSAVNGKILSLLSVVRRIDGIFSATVGEDLVIFDHGVGAYYGSGPVGEKVWALLEHETTVTAICDALTDHFEVDRATCEAETLGFLVELHEKGLLSAS